MGAPMRAGESQGPGRTEESVETFQLGPKSCLPDAEGGKEGPSYTSTVCRDPVFLKNGWWT